LLTTNISFFNVAEYFAAAVLVPAMAVLVMVPLMDFRVKGKADAWFAAKIIAPTAMAHIRILVSFMIFVVSSIYVSLDTLQLKSNLQATQAGWLAGSLEIDVNKMGTLTQKLIE
jgi:hypothetical protein